MSIFAILFSMRKYVNATQQNKIRKSKVCCVFLYLIQNNRIYFVINDEINEWMDALMVFKTFVNITLIIYAVHIRKKKFEQRPYVSIQIRL